MNRELRNELMNVLNSAIALVFDAEINALENIKVEIAKLVRKGA